MVRSETSLDAHLLAYLETVTVDIPVGDEGDSAEVGGRADSGRDLPPAQALAGWTPEAVESSVGLVYLQTTKTVLMFLILTSINYKPYLDVIVVAPRRSLYVKPLVEVVDDVESLLRPDLPHALGTVRVLGAALGHGGADVAVVAVEDAAAAEAVRAGRELEAAKEFQFSIL